MVYIHAFHRKHINLRRCTPVEDTTLSLGKGRPFQIEAAHRTSFEPAEEAYLPCDLPAI
jgi:hypothetical protein